MRLILALGRFRMDLEIALLSKADSESVEPEMHAVESTVSHPVIGFRAREDDDEDG